MKRKILIVVGVILVALIAFYLYFRTTPQYSLYQLKQAYKTHDLVLAKQYVDIDSLSDQLSEEAIKILRDEINKPSDSQNEWEKLGEEWGKSLVETLIPSFQQQIKDQFKKSFVESIEGKSEPDKKFPDFKPLGWKDLLPGGRVKIQKAGALRLVTISNKEGNSLTFRMRHEDDKWKIVAWENFGDLAKDLANKDIQADENQSKQAKFGDSADIGSGWSLTITAPETYNPQNAYDTASQGNKLVALEVTYQNLSNSEGTYDASNFELKDNDDHRFKREYSGKEPMLDSGMLPAGQKAKGFVTYEVPGNSEGFGIIYSSSAGSTVVFTN